MTNIKKRKVPINFSLTLENAEYLEKNILAGYRSEFMNEILDRERKKNGAKKSPKSRSEK